MLNGFNEIKKYNEKRLEEYFKEKIEGFKFFSKKNFLRFKEKYVKELDSINPSSLEKIYKETGIRICRQFKCDNDVLEIDMHSIDVKTKNSGMFKYDRYKSNIISEMENKVDEIHKLKQKIKDLDKNSFDYKEKKYNYYEKKEQLDYYVHELELNILNDLEVITYVDSISFKRKYGIKISEIIVANKGKEYSIKVNDVLKEDEFNGKYPRVLEIINGNYVVNVLSSEKAPKVDYYAHTAIDEVYGLEGKWGLVDINNNFIIKPKYVYPFIECGDNLQVMLPKTIEDNTIVTLKHGLVDKLGNVIIPIKYLYMEVMDNIGMYFRVVDPKNYKSGVLDKDNNIVVPFVYEYIQSSPDLELCETNEYSSIYPDYIYQVKVCKNDLYGIYDLRLKKEIIKPKYKEIKIIGYNRFLVGDSYEDCNKLINEKEKVL